MRAHDRVPQQSEPRRTSRSLGREVARYEYLDRDGVKRFVVVRYAEPKGFRQEDAAGNRNLSRVSPEHRVLPYRLPDVRAALAEGKRRIYAVEGEKDADTLSREELVATCNAGGAGKWSDGTTAHLVEACEAAGVAPGDVTVVLWIDDDHEGRKHGRIARTSLQAAGFAVEVVKSGASKDATDHIAAGLDVDDVVSVDPAEISETANKDDRAEKRPSLGFRFVDGETLLAEPEDELDALVEGVLFPGAVTVMVSPRGLGKSQVTLAIITALVGGARVLGHEMTRGRVLLADLDNPRAEVKRRLRRWRGDTTLEWLHYAGRQEEPPLLLDAAGWARVPADDYALVVLESANSLIPANENDTALFTRGVETAKAIAARGPAVLLNGNTTKDGQHFRGSGVLANLADLTIEVRDVTGWTPSGTGEDWLGSLPEAGEAHWAARAARRKGRDTLRLAVTTTKCRLAIEPPPRVVELRMPEDGPWTIADVTDEIAAAHEAARGAAKADRQQQFRAARDALAKLVRERYADNTPLTEGSGGRDADSAVAFLRDHYGFSRDGAANLAASGGAVGDGPPQWRRERLDPAKATPRSNPLVLIPGDEPWPKHAFRVEVLAADPPPVAVLALLAPARTPLRLEDPAGGWVDVPAGSLVGRVSDIAEVLRTGGADPDAVVNAAVQAGRVRRYGAWLVAANSPPGAAECSPDGGPNTSGPTPPDVSGASAAIEPQGVSHMDTSAPSLARGGRIDCEEPVGERGHSVDDASGIISSAEEPTGNREVTP